MFNLTNWLWKDWAKLHHITKSQDSSHQTIRYAEIALRLGGHVCRCQQGEIERSIHNLVRGYQWRFWYRGGAASMMHSSFLFFWKQKLLFFVFFEKKRVFVLFFKKRKNPFWIVFIASCNITSFRITHNLFSLCHSNLRAKKYIPSLFSQSVVGQW